MIGSVQSTLLNKFKSNLALDVGGLKDCGEVENLQDQSLAMLQVVKRNKKIL